MSLLTPVDEIVRGLKTYLAGVRWLRAHPRYLLLLAVPAILGVFFLAAGVGWFAGNDERILSWVLFSKPEDSWLMLVVYYLCKILLYLATIIFVFVASFLVMNVIASPVYEIISVAVERDITGRDIPGQSLKEMLYVMFVELKKVSLILLISLVLLIVPGINLISTVVAAFLIGWDFFDYPLARRGWSFSQRADLVRSEFFSVLGFGLWLVIPVVQIVLVPLAVAGGTMLNLEALKKRELLTRT
jgi:uncharacterized protein involved in cysteine biosynthesis